MKRHKLYSYLVQQGPHAGKVIDAFHIGFQAYPDQIKLENIEFTKPVDKNFYARGQGVWCDALQERFLLQPDHAHVPPVISDAGVDHGDLLDLCVTRDRNNQEVAVGDWLYVSSSGAVRLAQVMKIAKRPYFMGYSTYVRKLTVRDHEAEKTLTINNSRDTIKAPAPI